MTRISARRGPLVVGFLTLCFTGGIGAPAAQGTREICIGPAGGVPGSRVSVPVTLDDGAGVAAFQVDIRHDIDLLSLVGARSGPDTPASSGWTLESQTLEPGLIRVLAYTFPPLGLSPGRKNVAILDFDVRSPLPISGVPFPLSNCVLGDVDGSSIPCAACLQPGVDGAAPRFAVVLVDDGFSFRPARAVVEQGDWVLWRHVGSSLIHTTTSGTGCSPDGVWRGALEPGGQFGRRFAEPTPRTLPYFSEPDCFAGMTGDVVVTDDIHLEAVRAPGGVGLAWTGGSGLYAVRRSDSPAFVGPSVAVFTPDGGDAGTTFGDQAPVIAGQAHFYLVANKF